MAPLPPAKVYRDPADCTCILLRTRLGDIVIELLARQAPQSAGAFLAALDKGELSTLSFWRSVNSGNDASASPIQALQAGCADLRAQTEGVAHESTRQTGLRHADGTVSLARGEPGTGSPQHFFICIGDQSALDAGGERAGDGQGFAAFGRVLEGMEVVRRIHQGATGTRPDLPEFDGQVLCQAVDITTIRRSRT